MSEDCDVPPAVFEEEVATSDPGIVEQKTSDVKVFSASDSYNGAEYENYCWSQTDSEIEITILLPEFVKKSTDLSINIKSNSLAVKCKSKNFVIFEGEFSNKVRYSEAIWSVSKNKLQISLDKSTEGMWDKLLINESKIKGQNIDCSKEFSALPEDLKMEVERLDQQQNQEAESMPIHTMDPAREAMLRKAWDAEGSPFKGTPFDPTKVNFE